MYVCIFIGCLICGGGHNDKCSNSLTSSEGLSGNYLFCSPACLQSVHNFYFYCVNNYEQLFVILWPDLSFTCNRSITLDLYYGQVLNTVIKSLLNNIFYRLFNKLICYG